MRKRATWIGAAMAVLVVFGLFAGTLTFLGTQKEVRLLFSDREQPLTVRSHGETLRSLLKKAGYDPERVAEQYRSNLPWEAVINRDTQVQFQRIYQVTLTEAGQQREYRTTQRNVHAFLNELGVSLSPLDQINVDLNAPIADEMHIIIDRVEKKQEKRQEVIPYQTTYEKDNRLAKGKEQVSQQGRNGYRTIRLIHTYKNGKKIRTERQVVEEVKPQHKVVRIGTREMPRPERYRLVASRGGSGERTASRADKRTQTIAGMPYKKSIRVVATAYTHTGSRTATGVYPKRGTVAVDPRVIPYGTRLYIPGYGVGVAQDTGGAIVGNRIDLFYETSREAYAWGMRTVTVYILK